MRISIKVKILVSIILVTIAAFALVLSIGRVALQSLTQDFLQAMKVQGESSVEALTASATESKDDFLTLFEKDAKEQGLSLVKKDSIVIKGPFFENSYSYVQEFIQKAFSFDDAILEASVIIYEDGNYKGLHFVSRDYPKALQLPLTYDAKQKSWKALYDGRKVSIPDDSLDELAALNGPSLTKIEYLTKTPEGEVKVPAYRAVIPIVDGVKTAKAARAAKETVGYLRYTISLAELAKLKKIQEDKLAADVEAQNKASAASLMATIDRSSTKQKETNVVIGWAVAGALLFASLASLALAAVLTKPIAKLSKNAELIASGDYSVPVVVTSRDEIGQFGRIFELMRVSLKAFSEEMTALVGEKTAALVLKNRKISAVMENITQGILTITPDHTIDPEHSKFMSNLFGSQTLSFGDLDAIKVLFAQSEMSTDKIDQVHETLKATIGEGDLNWDANENHLPRRVEFNFTDARGHRIYDFNWSPMYNEAQEVSSILVSVQDMTDQIAAERKAAAAEKTAARLTSAITELASQKAESVQRGLSDSIARITKVISSIKTDKFDSAELFRELHTVKGALRTLRFKEAAAIAHDAET
ncbi:MAG: HAMP domain-containing protein, partial [Proteobacteria bacterium]